MARVFPAVEQLDHLPEPLNVGEQHVLGALRRLDDEWLVYVQPRLGLDQPDFVVLHPDFGVTAVEVKDWSTGAYRQAESGIIEVRNGGGWQQTSEAPRYQAHRYRDAIFSRFFADTNTAFRDFSIVRAIVVMVRHTTPQAQALLRMSRVTDSEQRITVWGGEDFARDPIRALTGYRTPRPMVISKACLDRLRRHLAEPEAISDQRLPLNLSQAARKIERNQYGARIRRVRGAAGSGKSLGLAARAARLASENKDVLVVTFNSTLPHYLQDLAARRCRELGASLQRITFIHLHGLCARVCDDSRLAGFEAIGTMLPGIADPNDEIVDRAREAYEHGRGVRYDAVLVDEGQDFSLKWWNFLRSEVCHPNGEMLLVADPTQDVYDQHAWTDEDRMIGAGFSGPWTDVSGSYRMPPDLIPVVADFARRHVEGARVDPQIPFDHPLSAGGYEATIRRWVNVPQGAAMGHQLGQEVVHLLQDHPDLAPSDVVFLAPSHRCGLQAVKIIKAAGFEVQHLFAEGKRERRDLKNRFWGASPGVKGCTVQSFKGWESRAVALTVSCHADSHRLAYVGLTRVKGDPYYRSAYVTVLNSDRQLQAFGTHFMAS